MAYTISVYHDFAMQQPHQVFIPGACALLGQAALSSSWTMRMNLGMYYDNLQILIGKGFSSGDVVLSGGDTIYNSAISQMIPNQANYGIAERTITQSSTSSYINAFYCGKKPPSSGYPAGLSFWIGVNAIYNDADHYYYNVYGGLYYQDQAENPTAWSYDVLGSTYINGDLVKNSKPQTKIYKGVISDTEHYIFAFGVNGNEWDADTFFVAIPCAAFKDAEPVPYVGETSEEDEDTGFAPNDEPSDVIAPRTNFDDNPYEINSPGSGIKVIFPGYVDGGYTGLMGDILSGIYQGSNEGFINRVTQLWASVVGGNTNRSWDEIQAIMNGILLSHTVPVLTDYTAATYQKFQTICGYNILNEPKDVTKAAKSIFSETFYSDIIEPRLNCFLDYEPYTSITLKLPFCPAVSLSPSAVYGKSLKISYKIDILTGILHCDVSVYSGTKDDYIIHSAEANVKTDIPIMGQGANAAGLEKITGAVLGGVMGDAPAGGAAVFEIGEAVAGKSHGTAVGKMSMDGISAYLSARSGYIIVTYPRAAIPASYEDEGAIVGGFLDMHGMAAALSESIGYFSPGFAKFSAVDLKNVPATPDELDEIESYLLGGVYL